MYRYPCADDAHNAQSNLQPPRPAPQVRDVVADNATCSPPSGAVRSLCRVRSVLMFRTLPLCTVYEQNRQSNHISLILLLLLLCGKMRSPLVKTISIAASFWMLGSPSTASATGLKGFGWAIAARFRRGSSTTTAPGDTAEVRTSSRGRALKNRPI